MKKTYWHLPLSPLVSLGTVFGVTTLFGTDLLLTRRLGIPHGGLVIAFIFALYGLFLAERMVNARRHATVRRIALRFFSLVFLAQLFLGLFLSSAWLFRGEPSLPHPLFILFSPFDSTKGAHLLFLWAISLVLTGPAFCSHLCWLGTWDHFAAQKKHRATPVSFPRARLIVAALVLITGFAAIYFFPLKVTVTLGFLFVMGAVFVMMISRSRGSMVQCGLYCPLGTLTTILSRISPFSIVKSSGKKVPPQECPFGQFSGAQSRGPVPEGCTLCGDCLDRGASHDLSMKFLRFKFNAWPLFVALVTGLHAAFFILFIP
ncbi:4Fe-4S binding protein [Myxococcota bacterium]|nr:4Fe-4S binding protein [Myxococcota bacterium]MBU1534728.1 4Fe-4S binding protein [Myxococcota bacterium]